MGSIKDIIPQVMGEMASKRHHSHESLEDIWCGLLEQDELKHTRIVGIKGGTALVLVDSPAWLYHIKIKQSKILECFQKKIPGIQGLHLKIGRV
jgi:hypothetical protein